MSEKITKSINIGILAVVFVFLAVIVIPRISAQEVSLVTENTGVVNNVTTTQDVITYKLDIPCAIDRTQIVIPNPADQNYIGQYKARCNSNAFFDEVTGIYHFKKNEGYYINLEFTNDLENKVINLSEIDSVVLEYYNGNTGNVCFYRKMESMYNAENKYVSKISYVQPNESKEFANNNMTGLINSCGLNTRIGIRARVQLVSGEMIATQNNGLIKTIMIDSDNSNQTAQENRNKEQIRSKEEITNKKSIASIEKVMVKQADSDNKQDSKSQSDLFLEIDNSVKKIKSIDKIFQENNIDSKKVVGEIVLDTNSNNPEYVFEVKEKRKLFGFIPIGSKIVQKKISATVDIKE